MVIPMQRRHEALYPILEYSDTPLQRPLQFRFWLRPAVNLEVQDLGLQGRRRYQRRRQIFFRCRLYDLFRSARDT